MPKDEHKEEVVGAAFDLCYTDTAYGINHEQADQARARLGDCLNKYDAPRFASVFRAGQEQKRLMEQGSEERGTIGDSSTAQGDFLKRLAVALGWKMSSKGGRIKDDTAWEYWESSDMPNNKILKKEWLPTLPGERYLVNRARAEGWTEWIVRMFPGGYVRVCFNKGLDRREHSGARGDTIPEATAYAVAKMFNVELPEGAE